MSVNYLLAYLGNFADLRLCIFKESGAKVALVLTRLNNLGSKSRRMIVSTFRFKKSVVDYVVSVAPNVQDVKVRVTDADVEHLAALQHVRSVELVRLLKHN